MFRHPARAVVAHQLPELSELSQWEVCTEQMCHPVLHLSIPCMGESEPLEDVVHAVGLDLAARPRDEPHGWFQVPLRLEGIN